MQALIPSFIKLAQSSVRALIGVGLILGLSACGQDMSDLRTFVENEKGKHKGHVEPLPEIEPYESFKYVAEDRRDPFETKIFGEQQRTAKRSSQSNVAPNPERPKEALEEFPLDSLSMVGTLEQEGQRWGLVQSPDGTIHRVRPGNYLGQNNGEIETISQSRIALTEIIPDGLGGWREREATIALNSALENR